jgi:hypothetical protein
MKRQIVFECQEEKSRMLGRNLPKNENIVLPGGHSNPYSISKLLIDIQGYPIVVSIYICLND